jgi:chromosome partitioning protein
VSEKTLLFYRWLSDLQGKYILNRDVVEAINSHFPDKVFQTKIRDNIALAEAPSSQRDIFRYSETSKGAEDYLELSKEILNRKQSN